MDEPTTYGPGPFTGIAHRIAWQHQEIARLRAALESLLEDPEPTLDEPDTDGEVILKQRRFIREVLNIHKHGEK